jgi:type IV pilus assembly protein PilB
LGQLLPEKFSRDNHVLTLKEKEGTLEVAFLDPMNLSLLHEIQLYTGLKVSVQVGTLTLIAQGLDVLFGARNTAKEMAQETQEPQVNVPQSVDEDVLDLDRIIPESKETKVIRLVNRVILEALREKASDIHLEPYPEECKIRYRIDGVLNDMPAPPVNLFVPILSRLKILCKMDIAEKRVPQDGAFSIKLAEAKVDVRVSTVPTVYGEKMVMRILNKEAVPLDLARLGFDKRQQDDFMRGAQSPHGLLFVTGPTGSGKSTTLYATLNLVMSPKKNILTVEDPVEYKFVGINQVQVKPQVELTFARALRAFLRQDPDVIMVGEVRDAETAQICLRAALTGHFVLSTLHTNGALAAVSRLVDMGIEPFLMASTLRLLEAQRLIRRLCPKCKEPYSPDAQLIDTYGFSPEDTLFRPKGCPDCRGIGYRGRVGVFEVIRITPSLRDLIQERAPLPQLEAAARKDGMQTLADNGVVKVKQGLTSLEEVSSLSSGD